MDITTEARTSGWYVLQHTGTQQWAEDHGTWQAHGVRLDLMHGTRRVATATLEVLQQLADDRAIAVADEIEPWAPALLRMAAVWETKRQLTLLVTLLASASEAEHQHMPLEETVSEELLAYATAAEIEQARASRSIAWEGNPLARLIATRLRRDLLTRRVALLAAAPDLADHPCQFHPAWELPAAVYLLPGISAPETMARELLAAWAAARDLRDPLITWAVTTARITKTDAQTVSGVSRSTINRLLPTD
ncbi:hypothetical protein ABZ835_40565 [Streptomyces sp. NPDC047461]|uniref:hypothetical protein n=1 Tax=Streptomyces sp. NPDC047461 TaxID=3155619 RepID=UPI0033D44A07